MFKSRCYRCKRTFEHAQNVGVCNICMQKAKRLKQVTKAPSMRKLWQTKRRK